MVMETGEGLLYRATDAVAEICLNNPPVNALTLPLLDRFLSALRTAAEDDKVRAVLITSGVPRRFCAGLDLRALLDNSAEETRRLLEKLYVELIDAQYFLGKPSIAVVGGAARGGGMTLAISCDIIIAGEGATFGYPEIDIGVLPAIHFFHLPHIVGRHRAFELLFSGRSFDAAEAESLGLVSRVVPDQKLWEEARALAEVFISKSPAAMRLGRAAFMQANDLDHRRSVRQAVETFCNVAATDDAREGIRAFVAKRRPSWKSSNS
jgi:enoyl-CoA hydratase/carnithine racemase